MDIINLTSDELINEIHNGKIDIKCTNINMMLDITRKLWPLYQGSIIANVFYRQSHDKDAYTFDKVPKNDYAIYDYRLFEKIFENIPHSRHLENNIDSIQNLEF